MGFLHFFNEKKSFGTFDINTTAGITPASSMMRRNDCHQRQQSPQKAVTEQAVDPASQSTRPIKKSMNHMQIPSAHLSPPPQWLPLGAQPPPPEVGLFPSGGVIYAERQMEYRPKV